MIQMPMLVSSNIYDHCMESLTASGKRNGTFAASDQDQLGFNKVSQNADESGVLRRIPVKNRL